MEKYKEEQKEYIELTDKQLVNVASGFTKKQEVR